LPETGFSYSATEASATTIYHRAIKRTFNTTNWPTDRPTNQPTNHM